MSAINTNVSSILARNALVSNERAMSTSMERLSTGVRINSAKDDAAGLAISSKMTSQIRGLDQAVRNANDAVSLIQTAEGALVETTNMLQRMRELAVQSASDTNTSADRTALNAEFTQLRDEINRVAQNTQWNGTNILDKSFSSATGAFKFQVGANAAQTIDLTIGNYQTGNSDQGTEAAFVTTAMASGPSAAAGDKLAQESTLTLSGTPALGDVISVTVGDKSINFTVTADELGGADADENLELIATAIGAAFGIDAANTTGTITGVGVVVADEVLTFTASSDEYGSNSFEFGGGSGGLLAGIAGSTITSAANSDSAISAVDNAIATVNVGRAEMGATMNRLQYAADNLANISANATESRGRILDADYAKETTELARTQIIAQAGTAMLAQANQVKQTVLSLLK
jgi:flagellin